MAIKTNNHKIDNHKKSTRKNISNKTSFFKNITAKKVIFTIILALIILFIFSNSIQNGVKSSGKSMRVLEWLVGLCPQINISEYFIRKLGHFCEFFILGIFLTLTFYIYTNNISKHIFKILFIGLFIPVCDETIQIFSDGRTALVSDVLLDFLGTLSGIIIMLLFIAFIINRKRRN